MKDWTKDGLRLIRKSMYLLDTNIFILAAAGSRKEIAFLHKVIKNNQIQISVLVLAEFLAKAGEKDTAAFERLIAQFGVLPVDEQVARIATDYRKQLLQKSRRNILIDCLLAAQAKVHNLTLATNNKVDFSMKDIKVISP